MSQNECGCNNNDCPHKTSGITLFDGNLTSVTVPEGSSLNDVLALLENYINTSNSCNDVNYTLDAFNACLNLPAGTYSFKQIIDAIVSVVCSNSDAITIINEYIENIDNNVEVTTADVTLAGLIFPSCFNDFTPSGSTSADLFNLIMDSLCDVIGQIGPDLGDGDIEIVDPDSNTKSDPGGTGPIAQRLNARMEHLAESLSSFLDNPSYIYEHTSPSTSPTSFTVGLNPMRGVIEGYVTVRNFSEDLTVNPTKDTYFYLSGDTTVIRKEVPVGDPAPADPVTSHLLYKIESDGSGVVSVDTLYTSKALLPAPLGNDAVDTINIVDGAVTSAKLDSIITVPTTLGAPSLFEITVTEKGLISSYDQNLDIAGISDGQILVYDAVGDKFESADNTNISSANSIPKSDAAGLDYEDSSLVETLSQVSSDKKVEINSGVKEDDANAILNVVGGPMLMPRLTEVEASALPLVDGYLIYVTGTNATFTSVGFWGVESAAWVKL